MSIKSLLAELNKLVEIDPQAFEAFTRSTRVITLAKKERWEKEGEISQHMGFVSQGLLRQYEHKEGVEFTTDFFFENDFVGNYISYQTQSPSPSATEALEPSELIVIPFAQFEKLYESIPATQEVAEIIGKRKLLRMHKRSSSLLMDSPEERYYRLMELQPMIFQRVPQYLIAQYLGIRPESLSRIRRRHKS
ncbi:MAG: Crp/Fnr family transcriptional regulator [Bacteroidota bacterium]